MCTGACMLHHSRKLTKVLFCRQNTVKDILSLKTIILQISREKCSKLNECLENIKETSYTKLFPLLEARNVNNS